MGVEQPAARMPSSAERGLVAEVTADPSKTGLSRHTIVRVRRGQPAHSRSLQFLRTLSAGACSKVISYNLRFVRQGINLLVILPNCFGLGVTTGVR